MHDRLTLAFDLKRYFWDVAIDTIDVVATSPQVASAPEEVVLPFVFDWKDQWLLAVGADFRASDVVTLPAGYNFGENPVPDDTLTRCFPATTEHHLSVGLSWLSGKSRRLANGGSRRARIGPTNDLG